MAAGKGESSQELTGWSSPSKLSGDKATQGLKTRRAGGAYSRGPDRRTTRFVPAPTSSTPIGPGAPSISAQQWRQTRLGSSQAPAVSLEDVWDQCSWLHEEEGEGEKERDAHKRQAAVDLLTAGSRKSGYLSRTRSTPQCTSDSSENPLMPARGSVVHAEAVDRVLSPHFNKTDVNSLGTFLPLPTVDDTMHQADKESTPKYLGLSSSTTWAMMDSASPFSTTVLPQSPTSPTGRQHSGALRLGVPEEKESTLSHSPSREPPVGCDSSLASPNRKRSQCIPQDDTLTQGNILKSTQSPRKRVVANRSPSLRDYKARLEDQEGHASRINSASLDSATKSPSHLCSERHPTPHTSSHPLGGLIEAKEKIISQKDRIIERQKLTVSRLQQECRENEARLRQYMQRRALEDDPTGIGRRLQELELESASLANQLREVRTAKEAEVNKLTKKLGAAEYELQKMTCLSEENLEEKDAEIDTLKAQIEERSTRILALTSELSEALNEHQRLKMHVVELEKYVGNMPSLDEFKAMTTELSSLRGLQASSSTQLEDQEHLVRGLEARVAERDERVEESQVQLNSLSREADNLRVELAKQSKQIHQLSAENAELSRQNQALEKRVVDTEAHYRLELEAMRKRHHKKFSDATEKIRAQHKDLAKRYVAVEKQLQKSSDCIEALHEELQSNHVTIAELQKSLSGAVEENQALLEKNVCLQEDQLVGGAVAEGCGNESPSEERTSLEEWTKELTCATLEMECLLNVCASLLENQAPDTSQLLGIRESRESSAGLDSHQDRLAEVHQLRQRIEGMRTTVADHFAAEVAKSCNVQ